MRKHILSVIIISLVVILAVSPFTSVLATTDSDSENTKDYVYQFNVTVDNPCNSKSMDKDAVNTLYFTFSYVDKNGYGSAKNYKFDMSWSGGRNNNADFLKEHFIRANDNKYKTSFRMQLPGKLTKMHITLNMDGGERLSFTIDSVYCNNKRINNNTDYVSSAYADSNADIYCSMADSVIDMNNSSYFQDKTSFDMTQKELKNIIGATNVYDGQFKDQFNADIDMSVLEKCIAGSDAEINQIFSHSDEESYYKYTFWINVENPIDLTYADYDEIEEFVIDMYYVDANGYGKSGKFTLDMSYSKELKRNKNPEYVSLFQRENDTGYRTQFDVWLPGILTKVESKLNMSGEKLVVDFEKITLNSLAVNTTRDYVSSTYFASSAEIKCAVPASAIVTDKTDLKSLDYSSLTDQYGARISKQFFELAQKNPADYIYHMY